MSGLTGEKGVEKVGGAITSIKTLSGKRFSGKMFIDATYEGDLMAAASVSYIVGREANSVYNETYNGVQADIRERFFQRSHRSYRIPGRKESGLLLWYLGRANLAQRYRGQKGSGILFPALPERSSREPDSLPKT